MRTAKQEEQNEDVRAKPVAAHVKHEHEPEDEDEVAEGDGDEGDAEEASGEETDEGSCEDTCDGSCEETDEVNEPSHYLMGKVQCIDAIESAVVGLVGIEAFLAGNVIKYLWRHEWKDGSKDLAKCHWYLCALMAARATREVEEATEAADEVDADDDESDEPKKLEHHE